MVYVEERGHASSTHGPRVPRAGNSKVADEAVGLDPEFRPLYALAAIAMWLTTATFGLMELRLGVVSRSGALVLTVGSVLAVTGVSGLGFTNGSYADVIANFTVAGVGLVGLGWMLLGIQIAFRRRPALMQPSQDRR